MSEDGPPPAAPAAAADDALTKYKKLLSVARQSLEANQKKLAEKDRSLEQLGQQVEQLSRQKEQLMQALEGELAKNKPAHAINDEDGNSRPRRILRRVDVGSKLWLLVEYPDEASSWLPFGNEQEAFDFLTRIAGEPLKMPHRCFTPEESASLESECRRKIEILGEEFRRFKVQTSIAQKQRDAQMKGSQNLAFASLNRQQTPHCVNVDSDPNVAGVDRAGVSLPHMSGGIAGQQHPSSVLHSEQEVARWKSAYEASMRENERLRSRGEEAAQASQWRERFETCERERNEALDRLHSLLEPSKAGATRAGGEHDYDAKRHDLLGPGAIYQRYLSLKEEFEIVRKKLSEVEASAKNGTASASHVRSSGGDSEGGKADGFSASRVQHSRHLVLQYLSCKDRDVRIHMEDALIALFRATDAERAAITQRRRAEDGAGDYMSSLTGMLGLGESTHGGVHSLGSSNHGRHK